MISIKTKGGVQSLRLFIRANRKPCSVLNDDLSRLHIAVQFKPPPESCRTTYALLSGVAAGKVYIAGMSPYRWWALTPPFHPYYVETDFISIAGGLMPQLYHSVSFSFSPQKPVFLRGPHFWSRSGISLLHYL